jgi:hypothetical protein
MSGSRRRQKRSLSLGGGGEGEGSTPSVVGQSREARVKTHEETSSQVEAKGSTAAR